MPAPLDPVIAQIIPLLPLRDPTTMTPQSARDALRALAASRAGVPPPPVDSARDIKVKGAQGPLNARVYRTGQGKAPTVVFFHGGGWVAGDLETHDRQGRWLAIETGAVVVSVDYRRPPETRFPGAFAREAASARSASRALCGVIVVGSRSGSSGMIWAITGSSGAGIWGFLGAFSISIDIALRRGNRAVYSSMIRKSV